MKRNTKRRQPINSINAAWFEPLESRALLSAVMPTDFQPLVEPMASVTNTVPTGYTPAQVRQAYGFSNYVFPGTPGTTVAGTGSGQTIAIVDAYDDPNIASDLHVFDQQFSLPDPTFTIKKMATTIAADAGWAMEISLDVEWAHAIAPGAKILLVEAKSAGMNDLMSAVDWARNQTGVSAVSMSFGAGEFNGENTFDSYFTTPAGHAGVTFVAAAGDAGAPAEYPSASVNVLSVGGTRLTLSGSNYGSETGWSSGGGGVSKYELKPSYQSTVTQSTKFRTTPDVAYDADPNTGFPVYDTVAYQKRTGWFQIGGTSAGAPQWAALVAIADQGRALAGKGALNGATQTLPALYSFSAADFHDVTSGNNGSAAAAGYDLVAGRGSPLANRVIGDLTATAINTPLTTLVSTPTTPTRPGNTTQRGNRRAELADGSSSNLEGAMQAYAQGNADMSEVPTHADADAHIASSLHRRNHGFDGLDAIINFKLSTLADEA